MLTIASLIPRPGYCMLVNEWAWLKSQLNKAGSGHQFSFGVRAWTELEIYDICQSQVKGLKEVIYSYTKLMTYSKAEVVSFYSLQVQFSMLVGCHVIENQEIGFTKGSKCNNGQWLALHWIPAGISHA